MAKTHDEQATMNQMVLMNAFSSIDFSSIKNFSKLQKTLIRRCETLQSFLKEDSEAMEAFNGKDDERYDAPSYKDMLVSSAFASIDFASCKDIDKVKRILMKRIELLDGFLGDNSLPMRTLNAVKIPATVKSIDLEDSSQRYVVVFEADTQNEGYEGEEQIRTDRIDGRDGTFVEKMWGGIEPGDHVVIYKTYDLTKDKKRPKVRVCPYVTKIQ